MRCFVAIELPADVKEALQATLSTIQPSLEDPAVRWVPLQNIHLTLKFLGEIDEGQILASQEALEKICMGRYWIPLSLSGFGCFPNTNKPRIFWIGIQDPSGGLQAVQEAIEIEFEKCGFEKERRKFKPHLTVARVKGPMDLRDQIESVIKSKGGQTIAEFSVDQLVLFRSDLLPEGARYSHLSHHRFQGSVPNG